MEEHDIIETIFNELLDDPDLLLAAHPATACKTSGGGSPGHALPVRMLLTHQQQHAESRASASARVAQNERKPVSMECERLHVTPATACNAAAAALPMQAVDAPRGAGPSIPSMDGSVTSQASLPIAPAVKCEEHAQHMQACQQHAPVRQCCGMSMRSSSGSEHTNESHALVHAGKQTTGVHQVNRNVVHDALDTASRRAAVQKRYRQKKEAQFTQLEDDLAQRQGELACLQQEHWALLARHRTLEKMVSCRDDQLLTIQRMRCTASTTAAKDSTSLDMAVPEDVNSNSHHKSLELCQAQARADSISQHFKLPLCSDSALHKAVMFFNQVQQPGYVPMSLADAVALQQCQTDSAGMAPGTTVQTVALDDAGGTTEQANPGIKFQTLCTDTMRKSWRDLVSRTARVMLDAAAAGMKHARSNAFTAVSMVEAVVQEYSELFKFAIQIRSDVLYDLAHINVETGEPAVPPEGHWSHVLGVMQLPAGQRMEAVSAYHFHQRAMSKVFQERQQLQSRLSTLAINRNCNCALSCTCTDMLQPACHAARAIQHTAAEPAVPLHSIAAQEQQACVVHDEHAHAVDAQVECSDVMLCTEQLHRNLQRDVSSYGLLCCALLGKLLTRLQLAQLAVASYPFWPCPHAIARCLAEQAAAVTPQAGAPTSTRVAVPHPAAQDNTGNMDAGYQQGLQHGLCP